MPDRKVNVPITLPFLDRFVEPEAEGHDDALARLKASLRRDLEALLNTRRTPEEPPEGFAELKRSLYNYGLPDVSSLNLQSSRDQARLTKLLESTIATFEPRLGTVKVSLAPSTATPGVLRFVIEGVLRLDPASDNISFDAFLEISSGGYTVK